MYKVRRSLHKRLRHTSPKLPRAGLTNSLALFVYDHDVSW